MTILVALDLETTGLDARRDRIIEIGAVKFDGHRIVAEWETLVHPGRRIPPYVTQLTGITDRMVQQAPAIEDVIPELTAFIGNAPILGQNIGFDLGFLKPYGIGHLNEVVDTYDIASVLLPDAQRYNLGALGRALGVLLPASHRALDDARVTHAVYLRLLERALEMPIDLIAEITRLSDRVEWGGGWFFRHVMRLRAKEPIRAKRGGGRTLGPLFDAAEALPPGPPLSAQGKETPLDLEEVGALLERGGAFEQVFPQFEHRSQQVDMLYAVAQAISEGRHLMVEAGTGTGKSLAYLTPAAVWALQNRSRVVISTNTRNLQDQLIQKDIPLLQGVLGDDLRAAVLKGRTNYLCPRRLEHLRRRAPESAAEMRVLGKVLVWLANGGSGDRQEINLNGPAEERAWARLSAEDEGCHAETCVRRMGGICPFHRAKTAAQHAHLLVVNHALLLADVATGNRVLPDYSTLIVDEAHHLEAATTKALSYRLTERDVERLIYELGGSKSGLLGRMLVALRNVTSPAQYAELDQIVQHATDNAFRFQNAMRGFFNHLSTFLADQREGREVGQYGHQERIVSATRTQPAWLEVETAWEAAADALNLLLGRIEQVLEKLTDLADLALEDVEELHGSLSAIYRQLKEMAAQVNALVFEPKEDMIYWVEVNAKDERLTLQAAPLHIGHLMERHLWHEKRSVILTSATLTTAGEFDYLRQRLHAWDADELAVGSPFDYENAALVYVVNDIPEPSDWRGHQRAVEQALLRLCTATEGRTLALFTSYAQLKRTAQAITQPLLERDILVYEQGSGASPHSLLESFRTTERAVLLGTRSFWEGVDVPGEALSVLVIVKLPFDVPSDPIIAARSETFEDPFHQYLVPEAVLRFRQGFGRLIRTQYDRGAVVILDRRVLTKRYGQVFLESLPPVTLRQGSLRELPSSVVGWLNL